MITQKQRDDIEKLVSDIEEAAKLSEFYKNNYLNTHNKLSLYLAQLQQKENNG